MVDEFIRGRPVHSGSPFGWLGSSGVIGFTRIRRSGRSVSLGSLGLVIWCRWVHSTSPWGSMS